jgi:hypothetical protein
MAMHEDVTIGEVYRRLVDMGDDVKEIKAQVKLTNGRTTKLESRVEQHDTEIHALRHPDPPVVPPVPPEIKELIDIARDAKGVAKFGKVVWAVGGAIVPLVLWWLSRQGTHP